MNRWTDEEIREKRRKVGRQLLSILLYCSRANITIDDLMDMLPMFIAFLRASRKIDDETWKEITPFLMGAVDEIYGKMSRYFKEAENLGPEVRKKIDYEILRMIEDGPEYG